MTGVLSSPVLPADVARRYPYGYALVDVETSGLHAASDRVLQVAVAQMAADGSVESTWSTLLDPGCDPGPTHVHGLTRAKLRGSPQFADVVDDVHRLVAGRIVVAHNAAFDHRFLSAESARAGRRLPVEQRLCTLALTRRLDLPVVDFKLASVAGYWGVRPRRAHDAVDDVRVLTEVLRHSLVAAARHDVDLPVTACADGVVEARPAKAPRTPCPWRAPGAWAPGTPLVQGMKVVVTGATGTPRELLVRRCTAAGLDVMNTVSGRTHVLVCNRADEQTGKAARARQHGTPVVTEAEFLRLLAAVEPGVPKQVETVAVAPPVAPAPRTPEATGPLAGRRVLVLGGQHEAATAVRARLLAAGASVAVNLTSSVTGVVLLGSPGTDPREARARALEVSLLDAESLVPVAWPEADPEGGAEAPAAPAEAPIERVEAPPARVLVRGEVMDLPAGSDWLAEVRWAVPGRHAAVRFDVDVVALVVDADEQVAVDEDLVFFNAPEHPSGAVAMTVGTPGEALCALRPGSLPAPQRRVLLAAAVDGETTFGDVGAVELVLRDGEGAPIARATLDAATTERSLVLATLYLRNGSWRWRAVGQGYDDDLAALAVRHGVDVEDGD
ncbi:TerD family protein [Geodermatophilus sp. SYSU D00684]